MIDTHKPAERAFIVGVKLQHDTHEAVAESLKELASLVDTAGAEVIESFVQNKTKVDTTFFIGKGKVEELKAFAEGANIDTIIFDTELSPSQIKNLENKIGKKILDRSWVILDIFASRAKTKEAKTQVELAQLKYFMPRLTNQWSHLSRQAGGGVGTKGPGETQLETDKRMIREKITQLEKELEEISKQRDIRRRGRGNVFKVILVGYTNVGKSTLMNKLSNAGVLAENRLFATLDSTTRTIELENKKSFLLSDTVGFINKLPHNLVASFKSTLEEVVEADLLLHIIDVSHENFTEQMKTVEKVLADLKADDKKMICVFNKADSVDLEEIAYKIDPKYKDDSVYISAQTGWNVDSLVEKIVKVMEEEYVINDIEIDLNKSKLISAIHGFAEILEEEYLDDKVKIKYKANAANNKYIESLMDKN